jgi:hypothetical protein
VFDPFFVEAVGTPLWAQHPRPLVEMITKFLLQCKCVINKNLIQYVQCQSFYHQSEKLLRQEFFLP